MKTLKFPLSKMDKKTLKLHVEENEDDEYECPDCKKRGDSCTCYDGEEAEHDKFLRRLPR